MSFSQQHNLLNPSFLQTNVYHISQMTNIRPPLRFYSRFYFEHTFIYKPVTEKMAHLKLYSTCTTPWLFFFSLPRITVYRKLEFVGHFSQCWIVNSLFQRVLQYCTNFLLNTGLLLISGSDTSHCSWASPHNWGKLHTVQTIQFKQEQTGQNQLVNPKIDI